MNDGTVKIGIEFEVEDKELRQVGKKVENSVNTPKKTIEQFARDTGQTVEQVRQKIASLAAEYQAAGMTVQNAFKRAYSDLGVMSDAAAKRQQKALESVKQSADGAASEISDVANAAKELDESTQGTAAPVKDLADAVETLKDAADGGIEELENIGEAAEDLADGAKDAVSPLARIADELEAVDSASDGIAKELREVNRLLEKNADNEELTAQKTEILAKAYETAQKRLRILEEAQEEVNKEYRKGNIPVEEYRKFNRALIAASNELEDYRRELNGTNSAMEAVEDHTEDAARETREFGTSARSARVNTDKFTQSLERLSAVAGKSVVASVGAATHGLETVAKVAGTSLMAAGTGAAAGLAAVGGGLSTLIGYGSAYNAEIEQLQASFEVMTGSAEEAAAIIERLRKMGAETPFETKDLAETVQLLMNYGVTADRAIDVMSMLGDVSQGNAEKMQGIAMAYGQMSSAGKVYLEDIKQMIERGFNPLQEISETTGESMDSLYKRISDGALSVDEITDSMLRSTSAGGKYFRSMEKQSQTMAGQISTLKDNFAMLAGTIAGDTSNAITKSFIPSLNDAISAMDTAFRSGGFEGLSKEFGLFLGDATAEGLTQLPAFMQMGTDLMTAVYSGFMQESGSIRSGLIDVIEALPDFAADNISLMYSVGSIFAGAIFDGVEDNADKFSESSMKIINAMVGFFSLNAPKFKGAASALIQAFAREFEEDGDKIQKSIGSVLSLIPDFIDENMDVLLSGGVGFVDVIASLIVASIQSIARIANDHKGEIKDTINDVVEIALGAFEDGGDDFEDVASIIIEVIAETLIKNSDRLAGAGLDIVHALIGFIGKNAHLVGQVAASLITALSEAAKDRNTLSVLIYAAFSVLSYFAEGFEENFGLVVGAAISLISLIGTELTSRENVGDLIRAGSSILSTIISGIGDNSDDLLQAAMDIIEELGDSLSHPSNKELLKEGGKAVFDAIINHLLTEENIKTLLSTAGKILSYLSVGIITDLTSPETIAMMNEMGNQFFGQLAISILKMDWSSIGISVIEAIISGMTGKEFELPDWVEDLGGGVFQTARNYSETFKSAAGTSSEGAATAGRYRDAASGEYVSESAYLAFKEALATNWANFTPYAMQGGGYTTNNSRTSTVNNYYMTVDGYHPQLSDEDGEQLGQIMQNTVNKNGFGVWN